MKDLFESSEVTLESIESITKEPKAQGLMLIGRNSGVDGAATWEPLTLWQLDERYFGRMRTPWGAEYRKARQVPRSRAFWVP